MLGHGSIVMGNTVDDLKKNKLLCKRYCRKDRYFMIWVVNYRYYKKKKYFEFREECKSPTAVAELVEEILKEGQTNGYDKLFIGIDVYE